MSLSQLDLDGFERRKPRLRIIIPLIGLTFAVISSSWLALPVAVVALAILFGGRRVYQEQRPRFTTLAAAFLCLDEAAYGFDAVLVALGVDTTMGNLQFVQSEPELLAEGAVDLFGAVVLSLFLIRQRLAYVRSHGKAGAAPTLLFFQVGFAASHAEPGDASWRSMP